MGEMLDRALRTQESNNALLNLGKSLNDFSDSMDRLRKAERRHMEVLRAHLLHQKFIRSGKTPADLLGPYLHEWLTYPDWPRYYKILQRLKYPNGKN